MDPKSRPSGNRKQRLILQASKAQGNKASVKPRLASLAFFHFLGFDDARPALEQAGPPTRKPLVSSSEAFSIFSALGFSSNFDPCEKPSSQSSMVHAPHLGFLYQYPVCFCLGSYHNL